MASVLSATAKNGWEGGVRRGVKLAVAMGTKPLAEHAMRRGGVHVKPPEALQVYTWGWRASTMASVLSATAKNGWEGGRRRGVKLAVAMGSHWLNMQCVEEGKNGSQLYTVCDFYLGGRRAPTMASAFHTTGKNSWEGGWGRGVSDGTPMGSHWPHMQRVEEGKNGSQLYIIVCDFFGGATGPNDG